MASVFSRSNLLRIIRPYLDCIARFRISIFDTLEVKFLICPLWFFPAALPVVAAVPAAAAAGLISVAAGAAFA